MSKRDALNRRYRDKRNPIGKPVTVTERDIFLFRKLQTHGALPTSYLEAFSATEGFKSGKRLREHLTALFNETGYLDRPVQQFDTMDARYKQLVHDLAPAGVKLLEERNLSHPIPHHGWWVHQLMASCITASIEIASLHTPYRFIPRYEIVGDKPLGTTVPVDGENITLIPDAVFGLDYGTKKRYFVLEADRTNENLHTNHTSKKRKTIQRSIKQYRQFIGRGMYKPHFGIKEGLVLLNVTTSPIHMQSMIDLVRDITSSNNYITFQHIPHFGRPFTPPPVMHDLFTDPWQRVGEPDFFINQP